MGIGGGGYGGSGGGNGKGGGGRDGEGGFASHGSSSKLCLSTKKTRRKTKSTNGGLETSASKKQSAWEE
ncbi:hypothetical protein Q3G72_026417 [Acer saccharum]|nr:hypothetical protein Q3G72_026417 [Acer saccharum]